MKRAHLMGVTAVTEKNVEWITFYSDDTHVTNGGNLNILLPVFGGMKRKRLPYRFSRRAGKMMHQI